MKKLNLLKQIIDVVWIISMPMIPILLFFIPAIFFIDNIDINLKINGNEIYILDIYTKIFFIIYAIVCLLYIYAIFLFKKIIQKFIKVTIFNNEVIYLLNKLGKILILAALVLIVTTFMYELTYNKIEINLGISNNIITLCLGLFFMVLSEIFKLSKEIEQENKLTI